MRHENEANPKRTLGKARIKQRSGRDIHVSNGMGWDGIGAI